MVTGPVIDTRQNYADGYGVWHSVITYRYLSTVSGDLIKFAEHAGRKAIRAELKQRGELGHGYMLKLTTSVQIHWGTPDQLVTLDTYETATL